MSEARLLAEVRLAVGKHPDKVVLWRNSTGSAQMVAPDGSIRHVKFGLCVGSSDLIGITNEGTMVAIELKVPGAHPTPQQVQFLALVKKLGGISACVSSVEGALRVLGL
jgi:hypothetical protein